MVEKKKEEKSKSTPFARRAVHEDEPEPDRTLTPEPWPDESTIQPLYSVGPGAPLAERRAAQATTERDRLVLKKKSTSN